MSSTTLLPKSDSGADSDVNLDQIPETPSDLTPSEKFYLLVGEGSDAYFSIRELPLTVEKISQIISTKSSFQPDYIQFQKLFTHIYQIISHVFRGFHDTNNGSYLAPFTFEFVKNHHFIPLIQDMNLALLKQKTDKKSSMVPCYWENIWFLLQDHEEKTHNSTIDELDVIFTGFRSLLIPFTPEIISTMTDDKEQQKRLGLFINAMKQFSTEFIKSFKRDSSAPLKQIIKLFKQLCNVTVVKLSTNTVVKFNETWGATPSSLLKVN